MSAWRAHAACEGVLCHDRSGHGIGRGVELLRPRSIRALYWCAVLNGVVPVPVMATMMLLTMRRLIMAEFTLPPSMQVMGGWLRWRDRCRDCLFTAGVMTDPCRRV